MQKERVKDMGLFDRLKKRQQPQDWCAAVVVAAGSSQRMGFDKLMASVGDTPVLVHTLRSISASQSVREIVLVVREELIVPASQLCSAFGLAKVKCVVRGGKSRLESARLGTLAVSDEAELIAIHDGARPFPSIELIDAAIEAARQSGAAAPAVPVKDTIKVARDGVVEETLDRARLFAVQTPQVFEASLIRAALQKALDDGAAVTDDCSAVERLGMRVVLTAGDERNIKLTTPADFAAAEQLIGEAYGDADRLRI